ncbi:MAG TPA: hypothetical protein VIK72_06345 [Clostridiaceae bacterium]
MIDKNNIDDDNLYAKVILSSTSKYLHLEALKGGQIISYLGVVDVYFDQVQLWLDRTEVFIDCILGTINLYIPMHWNVVNNIDLYCSNVSNDTTRTKPSENAPQLTLTGKVILGTVSILYI